MRVTSKATSRKQIMAAVFLFLTVLAGFSIYNIHLMDIEDRYGDLQQIYFDSKNDDIIVNTINGEIGIIHFDERRIFVNNGKKRLELDEWIDSQNKIDFNIAVYRLDENYARLGKNELMARISSEQIKPISHFVRY